MLDKAASEEKTYKWGDNSAIPQIDVRGDGVAYVHAAKNATNLPEVRRLLEAKGLATSSDIRNDDDSVLRVSGFTNIDDVIALLASADAIKGTPTTSEVALDRKASKLGDLKANSLRASGVFYMLGNILYSLSGIVRKDKAQTGIGLAFTVGDGALIAFGGKDDEREFASLIKKLKKHYQDNGIEIPKDAAINVETMAKAGGFLEKTYDFIHEHINVFKLLSEITGGALMFRAGQNQGNRGKMAAGAIIITGWAAALLIKEKKYDPKEYDEAGTLKKTWLKIQAQPLKLAGYSGLANNAFNVVGTYNERGNKDKPVLSNGKANPSYGKNWYRWDAAGVSGMIMANVLYSISKKTTGGSIKSGSIVDDVYGMAAQVLNHMDEGAREVGIKQTAEYLGERVEIKDSREEIEAHLRKELTALRQNPWFGTGHRQTQNDLTPAR